MRLAREGLAQEESGALGNDLESHVSSDDDDDRSYAAMGVAKTIGTVCFVLACSISPSWLTLCVLLCCRLFPPLIPLLKYSVKCRKLSFPSSFSHWRIRYLVCQCCARFQVSELTIAT